MDVLDRFLHYVSFDTQSDPNSPTCPSTAKQKILGQALADELKAMGLADAHMDENGYVYGHLPATPGKENLPCVGLIAHMDTSDGAPGNDIKPRVVRYKGGDIVLNEEKGVVMDVATFPMLNNYIGQELVVTDGTTLLGSDDKAGVAEIFTAVEYLLAHPEVEHGPIAVGVTPDEEIGRGADRFDLKVFNASVAYTVDGGELGELNYENFNGASVKIKINGVNVHPGSAKGKMKNALLVGCELVAMMPAMETPAHTEGREGFYHLCEMAGDEVTTTLEFIIRDHDRAKYEERKAFMRSVVDTLNQRYGAGTVELDLRDSYFNMLEPLQEHMYLIENAKAAMQAVGVTPMVEPIRGGTDGAKLTFMGLPCPNLSTGGFNFHGVHEAVPVESLRKMVEVLVKLVTA